MSSLLSRGWLSRGWLSRGWESRWERRGRDAGIWSGLSGPCSVRCGQGWCREIGERRRARAAVRGRIGGRRPDRPGPSRPAIRRYAGTSTGRPRERPASPWPGRPGRRPRRPASSSASSKAPSWWWPTGRSRASVQPGMGNESGPGSPGPNRLSTARKDATLSSVSRSITWRTVAPWSSGTTNWYWRNPLRAVEAVPGPDPVERVEETGHVVGLGHLVRGRLAEPELVEGPDGQRVEQATGRGDGHPDQRSWGRTLGPAPAAAVGVRAGPRSGHGCRGSGRSDPAGHRSPGSRSRPPSSGRRRSPVSIMSMAVVEVLGPFGVHQHVAGLDRDHPERGPGDDAGEAHAAGRGPEQIRVRRSQTPFSSRRG